MRFLTVLTIISIAGIGYWLVPDRPVPPIGLVLIAIVVWFWPTND